MRKRIFLPASPLVVVALAVSLQARTQQPATASSVPTEVQLPGTQPGEIDPLATAQSCQVCHANYDKDVEPFHDWSGSMMAHAARDPVFWATLAVAQQDYPGAGDFCIRCHTPNGWLDGRSTPNNGSALNATADSDGVTCAACHKLTNPDQSEWVGMQNAPYLAHDKKTPKTGFYGSGMYVMWPGYDLLGPFLDSPAYHLAQQSQYHRSAQLCGTCHDVSNPVTGDLAPNNGAFTPLLPGTFNGQPGGAVSTKAAFNNYPHAYGVVERTYSEHQSSGFKDLRVSDFDQLPQEMRQGSIRDAYEAAMKSTKTGDYEDGTPRTYTCQSCHMPPTQGFADALGVGPKRLDIARHSLVGGNYWTPLAIANLDSQNKLTFGGGLASDQLEGLSDGAVRAKHNLERAAALSVSGNQLEVTNLTGHKLISGYPEGRRMWLHTRWYDVNGNLLREDGAYGDLAVTVNGQATTVRTILDLFDPNTRIYEAQPGISQAFAAKLLALGKSPTLPVAFDRVTGNVTATLADVGNGAPGTAHPTFHFALNDTILSDNRIPPYAFSRKEASKRNALPVPASQYGDPPADGTYRCYDDIPLHPPTNAAFAKIDLLYQPTSWEYIQFLLQSNTGQDAFLANTGSDLYTAWRQTGMAEPHVMASATWSSATFPWADLGNAVVGKDGAPRAYGYGSLAPRTPLAIDLENGAPNAPAFLVIGLSAANHSFYSGTLVPAPDLVLPLPPLDATGKLHLVGKWPAAVPSQFAMYAQFVLADDAAQGGVALSNALRATSP